MIPSPRTRENWRRKARISQPSTTTPTMDLPAMPAILARFPEDASCSTSSSSWRRSLIHLRVALLWPMLELWRLPVTNLAPHPFHGASSERISSVSIESRSRVGMNQRSSVRPLFTPRRMRILTLQFVVWPPMKQLIGEMFPYPWLKRLDRLAALPTYRALDAWEMT